MCQDDRKNQSSSDLIAVECAEARVVSDRCSHQEGGTLPRMSRRTHCEMCHCEGGGGDVSPNCIHPADCRLAMSGVLRL